MKKIPDNIREIMCACFTVASIVIFIGGVVWFKNSLKLWIIITATVAAFILFILSIVVVPGTKNAVSPGIEEKKAEINEEKPKVEKKEFISDKEWDELEEEEEELEYIYDDLEEP